MFCSNCGAIIPEGSSSCPQCNTQLNINSAPLAQSAQAVEPAPVAEVAPMVESTPIVENTTAQETAPVQSQPIQQPTTEPVYQQPTQPVYQQPIQPIYTQPVQPVYQPIYTQPSQITYQPIYTQPAQPMNIKYTPEQSSVATTSMVMGILALCFSWTGIVGLIFSIIAKAKANRLKRETGRAYGKARAGYVMGTIGLVFSIICTICWTYVLIIFLAAGLTSTTGQF